MAGLEEAFSQRTIRRPLTVSTFVSVGNAKQPFPRLINAVVHQSAKLPQPVFIQYGSARPQLGACQGASFLQMEEFEQRVQAATLLILHAGAGCILHAVRAGATPVVVVRRADLGEHIDDHQREFANEMGSLGKIIVCSNVHDLTRAASAAMRLQETASITSHSPRLIDIIRDRLSQSVHADRRLAKSPPQP